MYPGLRKVCWIVTSDSKNNVMIRAMSMRTKRIQTTYSGSRRRNCAMLQSDCTSSCPVRMTAHSAEKSRRCGFCLPSYRMKSDVLPNHKPFESKRDDPFPWVRQFFWRNHGCALLGGMWNRQGCTARRSCRKHSLHSDRTTWQSIYI
jgi:hypothetical protein